MWQPCGVRSTVPKSVNGLDNTQLAAAALSRLVLHGKGIYLAGNCKMNQDSYLLSKDERPSWVLHPNSFCRLVGQGLVHITPWHILDRKQALVRLNGLVARYPGRSLFPFAYRQDNDDVACWEKDSGEMVFVVHDFASAGFEDEGSFADVWAWFRAAVDETITWD